MGASCSPTVLQNRGNSFCLTPSKAWQSLPSLKSAGPSTFARRQRTAPRQGRSPPPTFARHGQRLQEPPDRSGAELPGQAITSGHSCRQKHSCTSSLMRVFYEYTSAVSVCHITVTVITVITASQPPPRATRPPSPHLQSSSSRPQAKAIAGSTYESTKLCGKDSRQQTPRRLHSCALAFSRGRRTHRARLYSAGAKSQCGEGPRGVIQSIARVDLPFSDMAGGVDLSCPGWLFASTKYIKTFGYVPLVLTCQSQTQGKLDCV